MPRCPICDAELAGSNQGYTRHIERYHLNVTAKLHQHYKPVNSSGRSKKQIVDDWEARNASYLIGPKEKAHKPDCTCTACFHAKLDALVAKSEEAARDMQTRTSGSSDSDQL